MIPARRALLPERYLRAGDAYIHADVHGAATCILRAKARDHGEPSAADGGGGGASAAAASASSSPWRPLSPLALHEAGSLTVCRSAAWASRMVTSAWWVHASQVSKTAPTGA